MRPIVQGCGRLRVTRPGRRALARDEAGARWRSWVRCHVELRWHVLACAGVCGHRWAWLPGNVACNSHVNLSNFEIGPLELQRLWAMSNFRVAELHTTLRGRGGTSRSCASFMVPATLRFSNNVARNSHVNLSNFEIRPLELQRLWAVSNFRVAELRATLRGRGVVERLKIG